MYRLLKDPTGFLVSVVAWSVFTAATLLAPGAVFTANPIYRAVRKLPLPEVAWGGLMLLVAVLLLAGLLRPSAALRVLACVYATGLWVFYGSLLVLGGLWPDVPGEALASPEDGRVLFSAGGAYGLFVGACCALAAAQWAYYTPHPGAERELRHRGATRPEGSEAIDAEGRRCPAGKGGEAASPEASPPKGGPWSRGGGFEGGTNISPADHALKAE